MKVELLYFEGCPGYQRAMPLVSALAAEVGAAVESRRIETPEAAEAERFLGSPTVRVNGRDVEPGTEKRSDYGLKCRVYRCEESGQSTVPAESWIRDALKG